MLRLRRYVKPRKVVLSLLTPVWNAGYHSQRRALCVEANHLMVFFGTPAIDSPVSDRDGLGRLCDIVQLGCECRRLDERGGHTHRAKKTSRRDEKKAVTKNQLIYLWRQPCVSSHSPSYCDADG